MQTVQTTPGHPQLKRLQDMHQYHMRKIQRQLDNWGQDCMVYGVNPIDGVVATQLGGRVSLAWECNLEQKKLERVSCKHCGQFIEPDQTCPELDGYKACEPEAQPPTRDVTP